MKDKLPGEPQYSIDELKAFIPKMHAVSSTFYAGAFSIGVHGFIEFCGLMNKYIDLCRLAASVGVDFTQANVHGGEKIPIADHDIQYLAEKFECFCSGLLQTPEQKLLFCQYAGLRPRVEKVGSHPVYEMALVGNAEPQNIDARPGPILLRTAASEPRPTPHTSLSVQCLGALQAAGALTYRHNDTEAEVWNGDRSQAVKLVFGADFIQVGLPDRGFVTFANPLNAADYAMNIIKP